MEIGLDTPKEIVPLSWVVGRWAGVGVISLPGQEDMQFGQELSFQHDGLPYLRYLSRMWELNEHGDRVRELATETGFWRALMPADLEAAAKAAAGVDVEAIIAHPTGYCEVYLGRSANGKIDLATDAVVATACAEGAHTSAKRLYGFVEGDLLWVRDISVDGAPMRSDASARLKKLPDAAGDDSPTGAASA